LGKHAAIASDNHVVQLEAVLELLNLGGERQRIAGIRQALLKASLPSEARYPRACIYNDFPAARGSQL
jgi:hypothetical protein